MKKILSLVLAMMMVLSMATVAFAGTYPDVSEDNKALTKAVEVLSRFEVIGGFPDGTFRPEGQITRAEIAKMLVVVLGHNDIVEGSTSSFPDAKGQWFDSYAAIAQGLGIVNGFPDGTFKGNDKVTYSQAVTMILRALNYNNKAVNKDKSEEYKEINYKTTAARIGILENVTFKNGVANRGDIAIMLYNALTANIVEVDKDGNVTSKPIVISGEKRDMILLDSVGDISQLTITPAIIYANKDIDLNQYLGEKVDCILGSKTNEVLYVLGNSSQNIKYEDVKTIGATLVSGKLSVKFNSYSGNDYEVNEGSNSTTTQPAQSTLKAYLNKVELAAKANHVTLINSLAQTGASATNQKDTLDNVTTRVKIVTAKGSTKVEAYVFEAVNKIVLADSRYIDGKTRYQGINLPVTTDGKVNSDRIIVSGEVTDLADIVANDVIEAYVGLTSTNTVDNVKLVVTRDTDAGKIKRADYSGNVHRTFNINDNEYKYNPISGVYAELNQLLVDKEENAVYYLDQNGRIAFTSRPSVLRDYALVLDVRSGEVAKYAKDRDFEITKYPQVQIINNEGKKEWKNVYFEINEKTGEVKTSSVADGFVIENTATVFPLTAADEITIAIDSSMNGSKLVDKSDVTPSTEFITDDQQADYVVEIEIEDDLVYGIYDTSLHALLEGKKANGNFLANEDTLIFERGDDRNSYKLVKYADLTSSVLYYQYIYGWDVVVVTLKDKTAPSNVIYGVVNYNQHYSGKVHEFTGYYIDNNGDLTEGFETVGGETIIAKAYNPSTNKYDITISSSYDICVNQQTFEDNFMYKLVRLEKNSKGNISSIATASAIQTGTFKNVKVTMKSNRAYLDYTTAVGNNAAQKQLSSKLVVFLAPGVAGNDDVIALEVGIDEFAYYISNVTETSIDMTLYNIGSYSDLIDVIFIDSLNK